MFLLRRVGNLFSSDQEAGGAEPEDLLDHALRIDDENVVVLGADDPGKPTPLRLSQD